MVAQRGKRGGFWGGGSEVEESRRLVACYEIPVRKSMSPIAATRNPTARRSGGKAGSYDLSDNLCFCPAR